MPPTVIIKDQNHLKYIYIEFEVLWYLAMSIVKPTLTLLRLCRFPLIIYMNQDMINSIMIQLDDLIMIHDLLKNHWHSRMIGINIQIWGFEFRTIQSPSLDSCTCPFRCRKTILFYSFYIESVLENNWNLLWPLWDPIWPINLGQNWPKSRRERILY